MTKQIARVTEPAAGRDPRLLAAISEALIGTVDVRAALERTLHLVAELLGLDAGWVWLLDPRTGQFYTAGVRDLPPYLREPVRMTGSSCTCIRLFRSGDLTPANIEVLKCSRLEPAVEAQDLAGTAGLRAHVSIPLSFQGRPLGIMNIAAPTRRALTADESRLLAAVAHQVGGAIERARLAEEGTRLVRVEERARIAREIHDTLAQDLTAIGLHIEGALRQLEARPELARRRLTRALEMTHESIEEARRAVLDLRASPLDGRPLAEALAALGRAFTSETGIRVQTRADSDRSIPLLMEGELFRIVQEAVANVRRHAAATEIVVALRTGSDGVRLTISDNGRGFDPARNPPGRHGVAGMRERAKLLGGRLRIVGPPGRGTRVAVWAPLAEEGHA